MFVIYMLLNYADCILSSSHQISRDNQELCWFHLIIDATSGLRYFWCLSFFSLHKQQNFCWLRTFSCFHCPQIFSSTWYQDSFKMINVQLVNHTFRPYLGPFCLVPQWIFKSLLMQCGCRDLRVNSQSTLHHNSDSTCGLRWHSMNILFNWSYLHSWSLLNIFTGTGWLRMHTSCTQNSAQNQWFACVLHCSAQ